MFTVKDPLIFGPEHWVYKKRYEHRQQKFAAYLFTWEAACKNHTPPQLELYELLTPIFEYPIPLKLYWTQLPGFFQLDMG